MHAHMNGHTDTWAIRKQYNLPPVPSPWWACWLLWDLQGESCLTAERASTGTQGVQQMEGEGATIISERGRRAAQCLKSYSIQKIQHPPMHSPIPLTSLHPQRWHFLVEEVGVGGACHQEGLGHVWQCLKNKNRNRLKKMIFNILKCIIAVRKQNGSSKCCNGPLY